MYKAESALLCSLVNQDIVQNRSFLSPIPLAESIRTRRYRRPSTRCCVVSISGIRVKSVFKFIYDSDTDASMAYNTSPANTTTQPTTAAAAATTTMNIRGYTTTSEGNTQSTMAPPRPKRKQADGVSRQRRLRRRRHLLRELPDPNIRQQAPEDLMAWPSQRSRSTRLYQHFEAYANTLLLTVIIDVIRTH